jgi:hypothetical protein
VRPLRQFLQSFVDRITVSEKGGELYYRLPMILPRHNQSQALRQLCPTASIAFNFQP